MKGTNATKNSANIKEHAKHAPNAPVRSSYHTMGPDYLVFMGNPYRVSSLGELDERELRHLAENGKLTCMRCG